MQNVKDMKEVEPGIFVPTQTSILTDEDSWCHNNRDYSCVINRDTKEILMAFKYDVNGIAYSLKHFTCPTFNVGGYRNDSLSLGGLD